MMMKKFETLRRIVDSGLVAVIRADSADQAIQLTEACHKGGVAAIEVAFTVHGAEEAIRELSRRFSRGEFVLGAGTVLDPETARMAMLAGAQYVVTPALNEATVRLCNRYQIPCIPGAMTVEEVLRAMECGADIVFDHVAGGRIVRPERDPRYPRAPAAGQPSSYRRRKSRQCVRLDQGRSCRRCRWRRTHRPCEAGRYASSHGNRKKIPRENPGRPAQMKSTTKTPRKQIFVPSCLGGEY